MAEALPQPEEAGDAVRRRASHLKSQNYHLAQANCHAEAARYEAEKEFFDCQDNREEVEELLGRIVDERYRGDYGESGKVIDLKDKPARRYIAAERLFQQKLITLGGIAASGKFKVGLLTGDIKTLPNGGKINETIRGPGEEYHVWVGKDHCPIKLQHLSLLQGRRAVRVGVKFTHDVPAYRDKDDEEGIVTALENYLEDLNGDRQRFVRSLQQMCAQHIVECEVLQGYEPKKRNSLLQIMFHILDNEPSQFQSACFTSGDAFKFGMTVSFARLVKLFRDGHINLKQTFLEDCVNYMPDSRRSRKRSWKPDLRSDGRCSRCGQEHFALYSKVILDDTNIRITCQKIDNLYSEKYSLPLNKAQAKEDLVFLYGTSR